MANDKNSAFVTNSTEKNLFAGYILSNQCVAWYAKNTKHRNFRHI